MHFIRGFICYNIIFQYIFLNDFLRQKMSDVLGFSGYSCGEDLIKYDHGIVPYWSISVTVGHFNCPDQTLSFSMISVTKD